MFFPDVFFSIRQLMQKKTWQTHAEAENDSTSYVCLSSRRRHFRGNSPVWSPDQTWRCEDGIQMRKGNEERRVKCDCSHHLFIKALTTWHFSFFYFWVIFNGKKRIKRQKEDREEMHFNDIRQGGDGDDLLPPPPFTRLSSSFPLSLRSAEILLMNGTRARLRLQTSTPSKEQ